MAKEKLSAWQRKRRKAKKMQAHESFKKAERKLRAKCDRKGVEYVRAPSSESTNWDTCKRRKKMTAKLVSLMGKEELRRRSATLQSHPKYKRHEQELKGMCEETQRFFVRVKLYEPPGDTELEAQTRARRKRIRRRLFKYQSRVEDAAQTMSLYIRGKEERMYLQMMDNDLRRGMFNHCPLGDRSCPAHGIHQDHIWWRLLTRRGECYDEEDIGGRCPLCWGGYDELESKVMVMLFDMIAHSRQARIEDAPDRTAEDYRQAEDIPPADRYSYSMVRRGMLRHEDSCFDVLLAPLPSDDKRIYAHIKWGLLPRVRKMFGSFDNITVWTDGIMNTIDEMVENFVSLDLSPPPEPPRRSAKAAAEEDLLDWTESIKTIREAAAGDRTRTKVAEAERKEEIDRQKKDLFGHEELDEEEEALRALALEEERRAGRRDPSSDDGR